MIEPGTILQERYRIEKQIGQGGMGAVFVATDERFGSTVAIKETLFDDENLQKAFEREARLLNSLKHSALPKVIDYFAEGGGQFIVMEFISGDDLSETMEKLEKPFSVEKVLDWGEQLCDALKYLHEQVRPVIHRDIKPQNLKLTPEGQVILLDFGLAKGDPGEATHKTAAKSIFGYSRSYASLEQIQGTGTDPQSDIYSLSATLYHLMTGIPPADALTRAMNVLNGQSDPLVPAYFVNRAIPPGVAALLQNSMALNAAERPESAAELKSLLRSADRQTLSPDAILGSVSNASTELFSQDTKLMPKTTNIVLTSNEERASENSGEQIPTVLSKVTAVAESNRQTIAPTVRSWKPIAIATTFGIAAIAAAAYIFIPSGSDPVAPQPLATANSSSISESASAANTAPAGSEPDQGRSADQNQAVPDQPNSPTNIVPETKVDTKMLTEQVKKPNNLAAKPPTSDSAEDRIGQVFVTEDGEKIKITKNGFETDEYIVDQNGIRWKNTSKDPRRNTPGKLPIPPEEMRRLTTVQRQQLIEMMKEREKLKGLENQPPRQPKLPANN